MKIQLEISEDNEGTAEPWWMIIDPRQNFSKGDDGLYAIASMITGPFFSRKEAQDFLTRTRYNFGKGAKVYCHSGCYTTQYRSACRKALMVSLTKLKQFNEARRREHTLMNNCDPKKNGIECPECGKELLDTSPSMLLASSPPQKDIHCKSCGWKGYRVV